MDRVLQLAALVAPHPTTTPSSLVRVLMDANGRWQNTHLVDQSNL
jgi:hypothetical protein